MQKKLLLIEDNSSLRRLLVSILNEHNYQVMAASDHLEALALMGVSGVPDAILSDAEMSGFSSPQFIRSLKASGMYAHVPVLLIGGTDTAAGAKALVAKPIDPQQLLEQVRLWAGESRTSKALFRLRPAKPAPVFAS